MRARVHVYAFSNTTQTMKGVQTGWRVVVVVVGYDESRMLMLVASSSANEPAGYDARIDGEVT